MEHADLKEALKELSDWPTFPQLYFDAKLIGGSDILLEMHKDGSLKELAVKIKEAQDI